MLIWMKDSPSESLKVSFLVLGGVFLVWVSGDEGPNYFFGR